MKDKHEHLYGTPEFVPIMRTDNERYTGTPGDKAFLMRSCQCGRKVAFDYGETKKMQETLQHVTSTSVSKS